MWIILPRSTGFLVNNMKRNFLLCILTLFSLVFASCEYKASPSSSSSSIHENTFYRINPQISLDGENADIYSISNDGESFKKEYQYTLNLYEPYTDFEEVALFYLAFHTTPMNYFENEGNGKELAQAYGREGRLWKSYHQGDYQGSNSYTESLGTFCEYRGEYLELDIDIDGVYSPTSRGAGRLVIVVEGITDYGEGIPVIYYTEDHYDRFSEFYNYPGGWGTPFGGTKTMAQIFGTRESAETIKI